MIGFLVLEMVVLAETRHRYLVELGFGTLVTLVFENFEDNPAQGALIMKGPVLLIKG